MPPRYSNCWPEAAGQGFLYAFAGMVLFFSALLLSIGFDTLLQSLERYRQPVNLARL